MNVNHIFLIYKNYLIAKLNKKHFINIGSKFHEPKTAINFHNTTQKEIINENVEQTKNNFNKKLKRPLSTVNVVPIQTFRQESVENKKTMEKIYKKIPFGNLTNIDLDSLFQKQLQKLREINKCEEEEYKAKYNSNYIDKDNVEEKKNEENNKLNSFNKKILSKASSLKHIKNVKTINADIRPKSNYRKILKNLLPTIETSSPSNKNIFKKRVFSNRNFQEKKIMFNKLNQITRPTTTNKTVLHKEFGRVPKYLQEMKMKAKLIKDFEKKKEEEKNYPKGTKLLSEEERIFTLKKLIESKKELENMVTKLPIILDSIGAKNRQNKLFKELDEIEQAIVTFSKNKVFVKIDN